MGVGLILTNILALLVITLYFLTTWNYNYWKKRKVVYPKPVPFFGNFFQFLTLKKHKAYISQEICEQFPDAPYIGTFYGTKPALIVQDLELIKIITSKDFSYFSGRECSEYTDRETTMKNMFFTYGDKWKVIRQNTSPLFTSSKAKNMFHLIQDCTKKLEKLLEYETKMSSEVDVRTLAGRYTIDCICGCAFGISPNAMDHNTTDNPLKKIGDLIFEPSKLRIVAHIARVMYPGLFYGIGLRAFPKKIAEFFKELLLNVFEQRKLTKSTRNDFVDLILNLKQQEYITSESIMSSTKGQTVSMKVDDDFLVAQCVLFFAAGFETTAGVTSFALYELAKDQEAQKRVLEEVDEYLRKRDGKIEYDCTTELPFLDACVHETMRLYPVLSILTREVMEDYTLPDGLLLEKGLKIYLPVYHIHHHSKYFPEPEKFKPERFLPENKANIQPFSYMAFGEGHRMCVGKRVGLMQLMAGLVTILRRYRVEPASETPLEVTLNPCAIVAQTIEKFPLKLVPRD